MSFFFNSIIDDFVSFYWLGERPAVREPTSIVAQRSRQTSNTLHEEKETHCLGVGSYCPAIPVAAILNKTAQRISVPLRISVNCVWFIFPPLFLFLMDRCFAYPKLTRGTLFKMIEAWSKFSQWLLRLAGRYGRLSVTSFCNTYRR